MAKKDIVIHPSCIIRELGKNLSDGDRAKAKGALRVVQDVMHGAERLVIVDNIPNVGLHLTQRPEGDVYVLFKDNTAFVRDVVNSGDEVTLFGAYRGVCVDFAADKALEAGAVVNVSLRGTIK